ncbi:hypothetical protein [Streptomyces sp. NBC_01497]|uniref:hypothetical protein n=1 Tax=Streptomyces sp. NBC_01497 TaxID=2903885 RepID=UPI002E32B1E3|nr:hypothetical protein [Streptomyces sp. NBC_01497]
MATATSSSGACGTYSTNATGPPSTPCPCSSTWTSGRSRASATALLTPGFRIAPAIATDLLERPRVADESSCELTDDGVRLRLRPFQILTVRWVPERG